MESLAKQALIVEGGAMRGIFAAGVLDAFISEQHYPFELIIAVSAGATNTVGYLGRHIGRSRKIISRLATTRRFFNPRRFALGGHLTDVHWLWHESCKVLPLNMDNFAKAPEFIAVVTDVDSGQAQYIPVTASNMDDVMLATCALPIAFKETPQIGDNTFTDGGMADSIPVAEAYRRGARDITVVLSHPLGYRMKPSRLPWLTQRIFKEHPNLAQTLLDRAKVYNASLDFIDNPPADCRLTVIAPPNDFAVSRLTMDRNKLDAGYQMGIEAGQQYLTERQQLLAASA
ncbi:patatin-like phospholipase family protein [Gallaecimonas mangrovi]|uniref:patatin-like phospholipase family protein n=1 Tax=Gallaecimonas mangrovi TaxID=2291597 RepID=UPI000E1FFD0C|nr:patatin family protein [Gallaecimonas mangrovi]